MSELLYEVDTLAGLEELASEEISSHGGSITYRAPGVVQFTHPQVEALLPHLNTALSAYAVVPFDIPRPRALLGDQHFRVLLQHVKFAIGVMRRFSPCPMQRPQPPATLLLAAAGAETAVMQRLRDALAQHTHTQPVSAEGELLVRVRRAAVGWEVLIRLTKRPLAARPWRRCQFHGTLQATVAYVVAQLSAPQPTDVFLNVACGAGSILFERARIGPAQRLIGCDTSPSALRCARLNAAAYKDCYGGVDFELHDWDATALPLPEGSIDAICADLPFGHQVGSHVENVKLYPAILREAARVSRPGARMVLLSTEVRLLEEVIRAQSLWQPLTRLRVNLGGLLPLIVALERR